MKKLISLLCIAALLLLSGCGGSKKEQTGSCYYVINEKGNGLEPRKIEDLDPEPEKAVEEMVSYLQDDTMIPDGCSCVLLNSIGIASYKTEGDTVEIDLSGDYGSLSSTRQLLLRAGITKNFIQISGIDYVILTIQNKPLLDSDGKEYGAFSAESFVEPNGNELNAYSKVVMNLYFLDAEGNPVKEARNVYFNSGVPVEQVVLEELMKGPYTEGYQAAVLPDMSFNNVMIREDIGYVDFTERLLTLPEGYDLSKALDTIVRSFDSVCGVSKMQFSVNGISALQLNGISLDHIFEISE